MKRDALVAWSGADSTALAGQVEGQPDQILTLRELRPRPSLVTVTIGGNDVGFTDILTRCILTAGHCDPRLTQAETSIRHEWRRLVADYQKIRAADQNRSALILVVGYPRLFPLRYQDVAAECAHWLNDNVLLRLNQLNADLNAVIHAAAARAGLRFADTSDALADHEACTDRSWIFPFLPFEQQSGHPTKPGQRSLGALRGNQAQRD